MRFILVLFAIVAFVLFLHLQFPYVLQDEQARMRALYLVLLLSMILAGGRAFKGRGLSKSARDAAIWGIIFVVLVIGYSFRDEFGGRFMAEIMPSHVHINGDGTMSIRASERGHFFINGQVNGAPVRFLIDTGASNIVLTQDDAMRAGLHPETLDYSNYFSTANGTGAGASATLDSLAVGSITLDHVQVQVNKTWMHESLLGMSFLNRLKGFRVEGNTLVLMP